MPHLPRFDQLPFRRRIQALRWVRLLWWPLVALIAWTLRARLGGAVLAVLFFGVVGWAALSGWLGSLRRQFLREAQLPGFLVQKICAAYPQLRPRDADLVLHGLRQFFLAHSRSKHRFVAMPSKIADAAWHEFILHTRGYARWCDIAFGRLLHHSPAEVLGRSAKRNDGLRRTWYWACKEESIDPRTPSRLPLLFALDAKFAVAGGFVYLADCGAIDEASRSGVHCGSSFGEGSGDGGCAGDAQGFGGSESSGDGGGDGDGGGSGCGGD